jgi:hypothetical protein
MRLALLLAALLPAVALAQDAPRRKPGLWEVAMTSPMMPQPMTVRQCVDEKTDDFGARGPRGAQNCSRMSIRREGGKVVLDSVCQIEGSTATSRGEFSGDLNTSYAGDVVTKFSPPMHGIAESKMSFKGRHIGACAPGQKPGAITSQGGIDMQKMLEDARAGKINPEDARRMMEEMQRQYKK